MSFLEGREQVEDEPRAVRHSTSKRTTVWKEWGLLWDRRLTLRMISSELNLNRFTVHQILTQDLHMRKVCAKMVPKNLTTEQKANRRDVCLIFWNALRGSQNSSVALSQVMNHGFWSTTPKTKRQSREWHTANSPRPKKEGMSKSKIKSTFFFFWQSGDRPQGICATRTNCQSNFLWGSTWKTQEKDGTCATRVEILRVEVVLLIGGHWPPIKLIDLIKMQIS